MYEAYDLQYQARVADAIYNQNPPSGNLCTALFFGAGSPERSYVPVPVRLGLEVAASSDDLDLTWWLPIGRESNDSSIDVAATRICITRWPFHSPTPLSRCFTICVAQQSNASDVATTPDYILPLNSFFTAECKGSLTPLRGNVLVICHTSKGPNFAKRTGPINKAFYKVVWGPFAKGPGIQKGLRGTFWRIAGTSASPA
ncbi:hypothetical protein C8R47DRAFT_1072432 [Mycena vitilis]|nr:hypothetical protein C8R47DRAFT_1072432 [Mycena vitilis]